MTDDQNRDLYALAMFRSGRDTVQIASFLNLKTPAGKIDEASVIEMLAKARVTAPPFKTILTVLLARAQGQIGRAHV